MLNRRAGDQGFSEIEKEISRYSGRSTLKEKYLLVSMLGGVAVVLVFFLMALLDRVIY